MSDGTTPIAVLVERLERAGARPRRAGSGWIALCPGHELDGERHRPSLSIGEGRDGRALVHCFAGCASAQVVGALGLRLSDLFPRELARR